MSLSSMSHAALTPLGKDKHEQFGFNKPHSTVAGALYASSTGLSVDEISSRTGLSESTIKGSLEILKKNKLVVIANEVENNGGDSPARLSL